MNVNWDWLGGFFDGEGSVFISLLKYRKKGLAQLHLRPRIIISQKEKEVLEKVAEFLNLDQSNIRLNIYKPRVKGGLEQSWNLEIKGYKNLREIAVKLLQHTLVKGKQLELLLEFLGLRPTERSHWRKEEFLRALDIIEEIRLLNRPKVIHSKVIEMIRILREKTKELPSRAPVWPMLHKALIPFTSGN